MIGVRGTKLTVKFWNRKTDVKTVFKYNSSASLFREIALQTPTSKSECLEKSSRLVEN